MRRNCANCDALVLHTNSVQGVAWAQCSRTEHPVPQHTEPVEQERWKEWKSVFWRIPMWCPLPATMVEKTDRQQPAHTWSEQRWRVASDVIG